MMTTDDFFRARLDQMIDLRHRLAVLSTRMPWSDIESSLAPAFVHRDRTGRGVERADLFGPTMALSGAGVSNAGRPRLPDLPPLAIPTIRQKSGLKIAGAPKFDTSREVFGR